MIIQSSSVMIIGWPGPGRACESDSAIPSRSPFGPRPRALQAPTVSDSLNISAVGPGQPGPGASVPIRSPLAAPYLDDHHDPPRLPGARAGPRVI